ncbi:MAG TPA: heavy metal translocating P-type ATPase [Chthoniobacterales bacterium]
MSTKENICPGPVSDPVTAEPGVLRTALNAGARTLTIDYDPDRLSDEAVQAIARRLEPATRQRLDKCLMRLRGRACEACALNLERKAQNIPGVRRATATFVGGVMSVTFDNAVLTSDQVVQRVRQTGAPVTAIQVPAAMPRVPEKWAARWMDRARLEPAFTVLTLVFMAAGWISHHTEGFSHPLANFFYVLAYFTGGFYGVQAGFRSLRERTIDVDLLMVLAALGAAVVDHPFEGAMLLFLFSLSNVLQAYAIERTRRAIHALMKLRPDKALVRRAGQNILLPIEELIVGDIVIVRPGESIPLDAMIIEGESTLDESSLTGESMPVWKKAGDPVFAATINQSGGIEARVTKLAKDSTVEKLIRMVEEAQGEKARTQRLLDRSEQYYAMGVIAFTLALIVVPLLMGAPFAETFYRAMTVMVVASPCALIISMPASVLSAIGGAARRGVLFKGGAHLERTATVRIVAFDKTGTLTEGKPRVTDIVVDEESLGADALLRLAASVEAKSEHPLAQAIVAEAMQRGLKIFNAADFQSVSGKGASATVNGRRIGAGSPRYFETLNTVWPETLRLRVEALEDAGKTCIVVGEIDGRILGAIAVADVLREGAMDVVRQLKVLGVEKVVMLTGDNRRVAAAIARQAGVDEFHAELLPEDKVRVIKSLGTIGPVAMVGDGVNDAPALATASVGVAMGAAGTDVAMEIADVVLMGDNLRNIPFAISVSREARRVIRQNLAFAVGVIVLLVISALGFALPLPIGVVGHEGSTVLVCLNGLRLLAYRGEVPQGRSRQFLRKRGDNRKIEQPMMS